MKTKVLLGCVSVSLLFSACETTNTTKELLEIVEIQYKFKDNITLTRFDLSFTNESAQPICMSADQWPGRHGKINQEQGYAFLVAGGERYSIKNFNTGYCIGEKCVLTVLPSQEITGNIPFEHFDAPASVYAETKTFEYEIKGWKCDSSILG